MPLSAPPPETDRKQLARLVALAQWDVDRTSRLDPRRAEREERLAAAQEALRRHDRRHPAEALVALDADGPGSNPPLYRDRRAQLVARADAERERLRRRPVRP